MALCDHLGDPDRGYPFGASFAPSRCEFVTAHFVSKLQSLQICEPKTPDNIKYGSGFSRINREQSSHLVALTEAAWPDELMNIGTWCQQEWKDPEEPLWLAAVQELPFE